ncbi:MAG: sugar kinase [Chloroflexota bacterium]|nr:sugar kinase [Chloroflexota bacterium]
MKRPLLSEFDVVTLGEPLLRFTPAGMRRIEGSMVWDIQVGGSELNTAVGLARLGLRVNYLTRLTENALGRHIRTTLAAHGIGTDTIVWTSDDRVGVYYLEQGAAPRQAQVIYDRAGSAASNMRPHDLPDKLFEPNRASLFHATGISLAVSPSLYETTLTAAQRAKEAGWRISFDVNYRSKLWSYADALTSCQPLLGIADVIFTPLRDALKLWNLGDAKPEQVLEVMHTHYPRAVCVLTVGAEGALTVNANGQVWQQPAFETQIVDRIGGGDAFTAGFLYALLTRSDSDAGEWLRWGCAAAALKYTIPGDLPLFTLEEVITLVGAEQRGGDVVR